MFFLRTKVHRTCRLRKQLGQLDATANAFTLRNPMNVRRAILILTIPLAGYLTADLRGAVVFGPGSKGKFIAPGDEQMSGTAAELFHVGQEAEKRGDLHKAIKAYKSIVQKFNHDAIAPGAAFRAAELFEQLH